MRSTYRKEFAPRIAAVLLATRGKTEREIRRALREAFPMGVRKYWPYKVWLSEIRRQRRRTVLVDSFTYGSLWEGTQK